MEPTLRALIAAEVRAELGRKNVRANEVAIYLKQTRASISMKYHGRRDWRPDELILLAHWLDIPVARFLPLPETVEVAS